jgi:uncharacterized RDD family membrane protein YckC
MAYVQSGPAVGADVKVTGRRVVGNIVDGIVLAIIAQILTVPFGTEYDLSGMKLTQLSTGGSFFLLIIVAAYYILMEGLLGRTVGKYATGIKVVDEATGTVPGIGKSAIRTVLRIVDGFFAYLVGFIVVLANDRRKRVGDMAAKTLVVRA